MKLTWRGFFFINPVIETAFKKKQIESLHSHFRLTFLLELIILVYILYLKVNQGSETIMIAFYAVGVLHTVGAFALSNRKKNIGFYIFPFLEIWNFAIAFEFSNLSNSSRDYLLFGISKGFLTFLCLHTATNWILKCLLAAISAVAFDLAVKEPFNEIRTVAIYVLTLAMSLYYFYEEKNNRLTFGRLYIELENLRRWKFISEKFIPAGIIVVNEIRLESNLKRSSENSFRCLEILHYNEFFNKVLQIANEAGLLDLLRRLPVIDYSQPLKEGEFYGNSLMEMSAVENLHDLILKKCMRFNQKKKISSEMNNDELRIAELTSVLTNIGVNGNREEKNFEISLFDFRWEEHPCVLIIIQDISERKKNEKLVVLDNYKDLLMASVSHELKTPLNSIIGITSLILSKRIDEEIKSLVAQIRTSGDFLLNEINDILDFSLISKGKLRVNIHSFSVCEIIRQVSMLFEISLKEKNLQLLTEYKINQDTKLNTDFLRLKQVLINLVGNAMKFTFQGFIKITIEEGAAANIIEITVKDTGCGMRKEIISNLFQVFGTYDETTKNVNRHGVGLGLTISKQIVGKLGPEEKIQVDSQVGVGSEFKFDIFKDLSNGITKRQQEEKSKKTSNLDFKTRLNYSIPNSPGVISTISPLVSPSKYQVQTKSKFGKRSSASKTCLPFSIVRSLSRNKLRSLLGERSNCMLSNHSMKGENRISGNSFEINLATRSDEFNVVENSLELHAKQPYMFAKESGCITFNSTVAESSRQLVKAKNKIRILIVDDTPFNILIIENFLKSIEEYQFICDRAFNGDECLQIVLKSSKSGEYYDIIFMDCNMPVLDGFEASLQLRTLINSKNIPDCTILGVSAYSGEKVKERCLASGMNDLISKPMTQEAFGMFILKWIK